MASTQQRALHQNALRRRVGRTLVVLSSIACALWVSEVVAAASRDHAFPFLNIFESDVRYGVRLRPNTDTAVRSFEGRVTTVRTNQLGFRGRDWDDDEGVRVLLVGDSQMFGYNVDAAQSTAGRLEARGLTVFNAATPSWGPTEYVLALEELVPTSRPTHVVFVANVANDWFESDVPNRSRTTARDGWAVAMHSSLQPPTPFPGRDFILGRSHLVYAARSVLSRVTGPSPPRVATVDQLRDRIDELGRPRGDFRSRITPHLARARRICTRHDCSIVAAALPLDVQVYHGEWGKYRATPRDLRATERLARDFIDDATELGVPAVNLLPALRAASPGAFLPDDYHMSPRGHRAVADALTALLRFADQRTLLEQAQ